MRGIQERGVWIPIGTVWTLPGSSERLTLIEHPNKTCQWIYSDRLRALNVLEKAQDIPDGAPLISDNEYKLPIGATGIETATEPAETYRCLSCSNTNLDSRDLEVNPATGNIWGCNRCGGKKLEAVLTGKFTYSPNWQPTPLPNGWPGMMQVDPNDTLMKSAMMEFTAAAYSMPPSGLNFYTGFRVACLGAGGAWYFTGTSVNTWVYEPA